MTTDGELSYRQAQLTKEISRRTALREAEDELRRQQQDMDRLASESDLAQSSEKERSQQLVRSDVLRSDSLRIIAGDRPACS